MFAESDQQPDNSTSGLPSTHNGQTTKWCDKKEVLAGEGVYCFSGCDVCKTADHLLHVCADFNHAHGHQGFIKRSDGNARTDATLLKVGPST
jgi:hypothetical protein